MCSWLPDDCSALAVPSRRGLAPKICFLGPLPCCNMGINITRWLHVGSYTYTDNTNSMYKQAALSCMYKQAAFELHVSRPEMPMLYIQSLLLNLDKGTHYSLVSLYCNLNTVTNYFTNCFPETWLPLTTPLPDPDAHPAVKCQRNCFPHCHRPTQH